MIDQDRKKLRIAIICDPISDAIAGVIVSTHRFAERLRDRGHTVIFIAASSSDATEEFRGSKVYRFRSLPLPRSNGEWRISFPTPSEIERILVSEEIDIVHAMLPMPSSVASLKAARNVGIPSIIHSHAQPENVLLHLPSFLPLKPLIRAYYRILYWLYKKADGLVYPSEFAKNLFSGEMGARPAVVISNGVDTSHFTRIDGSAFRARAGIGTTAPHLLFTGRIQPEKSLDTLVRAVPIIRSRFPDVHVSIVGSGDLLTPLRKLAARLDVADSITFHGRISNEELLEAYSSADLFVMPSLAELEGMVVLEAMAVGLPLLVADASESASTYFVSDNGSLFKPRDHEDLAREAIRMLSDTKQLKKQGELSRTYAEAFDIEESVSRLEDFYFSFL